MMGDALMDFLERLKTRWGTNVVLHRLDFSCPDDCQRFVGSVWFLHVYGAEVMCPGNMEVEFSQSEKEAVTLAIGGVLTDKLVYEILDRALVHQPRKCKEIAAGPNGQEKLKKAHDALRSEGKLPPPPLWRRAIVYCFRAFVFFIFVVLIPMSAGLAIRRKLGFWHACYPQRYYAFLGISAAVAATTLSTIFAALFGRLLWGPEFVIFSPRAVLFLFVIIPATVRVGTFSVLVLKGRKEVRASHDAASPFAFQGPNDRSSCRETSLCCVRRIASSP